MSKPLAVLAFLCALAPWPAAAQLPALPAPAAGGSSQGTDDIRKNYRLHVGPFYVNPALLLKELGMDTNVFNAAGDEKSDFTATIAPQLDLALPFARRGLLKATLGADLVYFQTYAAERSVDPEATVRAEAYAHRLTLFVEDSYLNSRQRLNYEIDLRSRHLQNDLSGGLAIRFTSKLSLEGARRHGETRFAGDAVFFGQNLKQTLDQNKDAYAVTARYRHTALTTFGVRYEHEQDRFPLSPVRDTNSFRVMPGVEFKPKALINGSAWVGYRSFTPKDPVLPPQKGLVSELGLSYTLLSATTFGVTYDRDYQFAFQVERPYFLDNGVGVFVRRALGGKFDVIANAARHRYAYQNLAVATAQFAALPQRTDTTDNLGLNLGYRLKRLTRVGFGASYWTRDSPAEVFRRYKGLRFGTTVTYGF